MAAYFNLNNNDISMSFQSRSLTWYWATKVDLCYMTKTFFLPHYTNLLDLFRNSHWSVRKAVLKKRLQHWCFIVKFAKFLRTSILKNICETLLLFLPPQNTIANSSGEFRLDETLTECKVSIFFKPYYFIRPNRAISLIYKWKIFLWHFNEHSY